MWVVAGLLAWTGASSFAELGSAMPLNGGAQAYLNQIYGPVPSFMFSWTALTILKPGSAAIIAIIFAEYFTRGIGGTFLMNEWIQKIMALLGLVVMALVNMYSTKLGAHAATLFLVVKVGLLVTVAVMGLVSMHKFDDSALHHNLFAGSSTDSGQYAIALYGGLWAYDGWENANYVAAEMKNARRDLPRVIHTAMPVVILAYVLANISYYAVMSEDQIENAASVALTFATLAINPAAGAALAIIIGVSCLGALNATLFSSARLIHSAASEGFVPSLFADLSPSRQTPVNAILLHGLLTTCYILVGDFQSLLTLFGVAAYTFYFMTVLGVVVLRFKEPELDRPYRTWLVTPIVFCCVSLFLISRTLFEKPLQSLFVALFILSGLPVYYYRTEDGISWSRILQVLRIRR